MVNPIHFPPQPSQGLLIIHATPSAAQAPGHGNGAAPPGHGSRARSAALRQTRRSLSRKAGPGADGLPSGKHRKSY